MLKPAICTSFGSGLPFARAAEMVRQAGFEVISLGGDPEREGYGTPAGRAVVREVLRRHGLGLDSVHAPFPQGDRLFSLDEGERQESLRLCEMALEAAADLGGRTVVIHLIQPYGIPPGDVRTRMVDQGRRSVGGLGESARRRGVRLGLENGQEAAYDQVLSDFLGEFAAEHVGLCYDSGHENVQGRCFRLLERFGHRLVALHIHDNRGTDTHTLPYEGTIDWGRFREVLRGLPFTGCLLLEADIRNSQFRDPATFLGEAYARAVRVLG